MGGKTTENERIFTSLFRRGRAVAGLLALTLLFGGCGAAPPNERQEMDSAQGSSSPIAMGRYMEERIAGNYEEVYIEDIYPIKEGIYLARRGGQDEILFSEGEEVTAKMQYQFNFRPISDEKWVPYLAVADNGARIFSVEETEGEAVSYQKFFMSAEGELREWTEYAGEEQRANYWYGRDGYFYVTAFVVSDSQHSTALYRVDVETGETEYLWEFSPLVNYLSVCGDYVFAGYYDGIEGGFLTYSLSRKEPLPEDSVLGEALQKHLMTSSGMYSFPWLIVPSSEEESVYVLTRDGLFYHRMYGSVMEQVIEGSLCSIGDISKGFSAMCVTEGGAGDMPVFWLAYESDEGGEVRRFVFDKNIPSVPDTMVRVYSLYEDGNVRQAVAGYQGAHPELYMQYEAGVAEDAGQTREDALKNLATRIASGEGPDVLVMDGIPLSSYREKGVLKDLSELYETIRAEESYFENVADCFYQDGELYTLPMAFQFTVLMGKKEQIGDADNLEEFAALLEGLAVDNTSKIGLLREDIVLTAMEMAAGGNWIDEEGELDQEALSRFLTLCRRVYDADRAGLPEEKLAKEIEDRGNIRWFHSGGGNLYAFLDGNQLYCANALNNSYTNYGNPLFMGSIGGDALMEYRYLTMELDYLGVDFRIMSDEGTACVPKSLLAVNNASGVQAEAEDFVRYALCADFQAGTVLSGVPLNKDALSRDMETFGTRYAATGLGSLNAVASDYVVLTSEELSVKDYTRYLEAIDRIDRVNLCDSILYDTVMELGVYAVNGEKSIEETVEAIAKKVQLYLAE